METGQRRHERYTVEIGGEVTIGPETVAVATQNLSEGGAALLLDIAVDRGAVLDLSLFLTQDGIEDPDREPFETKATVAWVRPYAGGRTLAGVGFGVVSPAGKRVLRAFLSAVK